jgi:hypothetical protein
MSLCSGCTVWDHRSNCGLKTESSWLRYIMVFLKSSTKILKTAHGKFFHMFSNLTFIAPCQIKLCSWHYGDNGTTAQTSTTHFLSCLLFLSLFIDNFWCSHFLVMSDMYLVSSGLKGKVYDLFQDTSLVIAWWDWRRL